jgi:hypothetical protein
VACGFCGLPDRSNDGLGLVPVLGLMKLKLQLKLCRKLSFFFLLLLPSRI